MGDKTDERRVLSSEATFQLITDPSVNLRNITDHPFECFALDRGHMVPAADAKQSQEAMSETFLLSNIAPQVGDGFNRHCKLLLSMTMLSTPADLFPL